MTKEIVAETIAEKLVDSGRLLSEKEVAELLNVHIQTLRNWRFNGKGPPYLKIQTAVRYDLKDVENYKNACRVVPKTV